MSRSRRSISLVEGPALRDRRGRRGAAQTRLVISAGRGRWMNPPFNAPMIRFHIRQLQKLQSGSSFGVGPNHISLGLASKSIG